MSKHHNQPRRTAEDAGIEEVSNAETPKMLSADETALSPQTQVDQLVDRQVVSAVRLKRFSLTPPGGEPIEVEAETLEDAVRNFNGPNGDSKGRVYTAKNLRARELV